MTQPTNTFQDIVAALEQDPVLRKQLMQHILTEALLKLPAVVGLLEDGEEPVTSQLRSLGEQTRSLGEQVNSLSTRMEPVETLMQRVDSRTGEQEGRHYERTMAGQAQRLLYEAMGLRHAEVIYRSTDRYGEDAFHALLDQERRPLNLTEFQDLDAIDFVAQGMLTDSAGAQDETQEQVYVTVEASITGEARDVRRADRRSRLLAQATGTPCRPFIIAERLDARLTQALADPEQRFPTVSAEQFNQGAPPEDAENILRQDVLAIIMQPQD